MVNHELRNALAAVYGWSEMLVRKKDPATVPRAAFEVLDSAAAGGRADQRPARPEPAGRGPPEAGHPRRRAGGDGPAGDRPGHSRGRGRDRSASSCDVGPDLPTCETDASRLEQILVNLLGNAIQHTPDAQHRPARGSAHASGMVVYAVEDEGPGIPETDVERIFDIYVTKAAGDSRGVGLGLPLSRRLARLLGGELRAVPQPGRGRPLRAGAARQPAES